MEYGSDRYFDSFIRSLIPIFHLFITDTKRGKVPRKNPIFYTFCKFWSNELKNHSLWVVIQILQSLGIGLGIVWSRMTLTKWNSGYTHLKSIKIYPNKSGIIHGKKFSDFNLFPNCLKIWSNVAHSMLFNWLTFGELSMEAVGAEFFFSTDWCRSVQLVWSDFVSIKTQIAKR